MMTLTFRILETDTRFVRHTEPGDPDHLCSRCGKPIGDDVVPICCWPESGLYEYRYHPECLGFR